MVHQCWTWNLPLTKSKSISDKIKPCGMLTGANSKQLRNFSTAHLFIRIRFYVFLSLTSSVALSGQIEFAADLGSNRLIAPKNKPISLGAPPLALSIKWHLQKCAGRKVCSDCQYHGRHDGLNDGFHDRGKLKGKDDFCHDRGCDWESITGSDVFGNAWN